MSHNHPTFNVADIARSFSEAAPHYDRHAFVQTEIGQRLIERLSCIQMAPSLILDVGAGTGKLTRELQTRFPNSTVVGVDVAQGMVDYARNQQSWKPFRKQPKYLCANMSRLPFKSQSVDVIFSNFTLQWGNDLKAIFAEFKRVLSPKGMLFFTTLGPQTLFELRKSFAKVDDAIHVHTFWDMHDIGDLLLNCPFTDPVVDMEMLTVSYRDVSSLLSDLKGTGANNLDPSRRKGCTTQLLLKQMLRAYEEDFKRPDCLYPATYEVIYGHACNGASMLHKQDKTGLITIPADKIPRLL